MTAGPSVAFIVARLGSSRLPGKQLRTIGGVTLLQWVLESLKQCRHVDRIVLATVAEEENKPLQQWTEDHRIDCFWYEGEQEHVTTRLRKAAEHFNAHICILISGDCPLIDPLAVDTLIQRLRTAPEADYTVTPSDAGNQSCMLQGVLVATRDCWQRGDDLSNRPELKEHQFPIFGLRPDVFKALPCSLDSTLYGRYHRLSIDTWSDLRFCNRLHDLLKEKNRPFSLAQAVALLKEQPQLMAINRHVHQKKLIEHTQRLLIAFSVPPQTAVFHAYKQLAIQIVDRLGWPVTFLNADAQLEQIKEIGMRSLSVNHPDDCGAGNLQDRFDLLVVVADDDVSLWRHLPHGVPTLNLTQEHDAHAVGNTLPFSPFAQSGDEVDVIVGRLQQMATRGQF